MEVKSMAAIIQQPKALTFQKLSQANRTLTAFHISDAFPVLKNLKILNRHRRRSHAPLISRRRVGAIRFHVGAARGSQSSPAVLCEDGVEGDYEQSSCENDDDGDDERGEIGAGIVAGNFIRRWRRKDVDAPLKTAAGADSFWTISIAFNW
nr:hypothetical protein Iba_chr09eCG1220 [Ipomoea batatas]